MLARAFQDDPLMCEIIPEAERRRRLLPRVIGWNVRYACRYGEVYATPQLEGAVVWLGPGATTMTLARQLRAGLWAAPLQAPWGLLPQLAGVGDELALLHHGHAPMPHWYLSQLGVEPHRQGQGLGSALLRPMLARLTARGAWCYLETAAPRTFAFYQRHGFTLVEEARVCRGSVPIWALLRAP